MCKSCTKSSYLGAFSLKISNFYFWGSTFVLFYHDPMLGAIPIPMLRSFERCHGLVFEIHCCIHSIWNNCPILLFWVPRLQWIDRPPFLFESWMACRISSRNHQQDGIIKVFTMPHFQIWLIENPINWNPNWCWLFGSYLGAISIPYTLTIPPRMSKPFLWPPWIGEI